MNLEIRVELRRNLLKKYFPTHLWFAPNNYIYHTQFEDFENWYLKPSTTWNSCSLKHPWLGYTAFTSYIGVISIASPDWQIIRRPGGVVTVFIFLKNLGIDVESLKEEIKLMGEELNL